MGNVSTYNDLIPYMIDDLPGCDQNTILRYLKMAGRQFCYDTEFIYEEEKTQNISKEQVLFLIEPSYDWAVHRIKEVKINGAVLSPNLYEVVFDDNADCYVKLKQAIGRDIPNGFACSFFIHPLINSVDIPEFILQRWSEAIIAGAKAKIMLLQKKPFTNAELAVFYDRMYRKFVCDAKREKYTKYESQDIFLKGRSFV